MPSATPSWVHTPYIHTVPRCGDTTKRQKECSLSTRQQQQHSRSRLVGRGLAGGDSPRLQCSSQRRREPCSGRRNTAGRPACGTTLLAERWTGGARRPTIARTPGLFPAWRWLATSSATSACARWRTAAWWSSCSSNSKITIYMPEAGDRSCTLLWR